jgi:hypothetical protein
MKFMARAGLVARGAMYAVIGWIALQIASGNGRQQADKTGALRQLSGTPFGAAALWLLVAGLLGMTVWQLSAALYGGPGPAAHKASARLAAFCRAVIYAVTGYGAFKYALGAGAPASSNQQSVDLTTTLMRHPGGQAVVVIIGLGFIAAGSYLGYRYWHKEFLGELRMSQVRAGTRRVIERLGQAGGVARGIVFATAGIFLVVAALRRQPQQARGIDSSLRALAVTPLGPWLLVLVATGLIMFGVFSCCEARWQRF